MKMSLPALALAYVLFFNDEEKKESKPLPISSILSPKKKNKTDKEKIDELLEEEDTLEGGGGSDTLGSNLPPAPPQNSLVPQAFLSNGLPVTLPAGTTIINGAQSVTLSSPVSAQSVLNVLPAGGKIVLPNGFTYTKPNQLILGNTQPIGSTNQGSIQWPATGLGQGTGLSFQDQLLLGLAQGIGANAPALVQAGGNLVGGAVNLIGSGVSSFVDWLNSPSAPSNGGSNPYADSGLAGVDIFGNPLSGGSSGGSSGYLDSGLAGVDIFGNPV